MRPGWSVSRRRSWASLASAKNAQAPPVPGRIVGDVTVTPVRGSVAPGVDFLQLRKTSELYRGIKAHYAVSLTVDGRSVTRLDGHDCAQTSGTINLMQPGQLHCDLH